MISIIMSVYNERSNIEKSLNSILRQSFSFWELIVVDDASSDGTLEILNKYSQYDKRIIVLRNVENRGLAYSLNKAIEKAHFDFIARFDADDIMLENRLDTQIQFLKKNSDIDVVGSFAYDVDSDYKIVGQSTRPESHEEIINLIYKENPFVHPTVLAKKNFFKNLHGYDTSLKRAQDYDLWLRGYKKFNYHNIQIPLIKYRRREKTKFRDCLYSFWVLQKNFYRDIKNYRIFFSSFRPIAAWILRKIIFFVSGKKNII